MENARAATAEDLDSLMALWQAGVAELEGQRGGSLLAGDLVRADLGQALRESLEDPERLLVVGLIDEVPVGLASVHSDSGRRPPVAHLELIYVEVAARQVGVAEAMVAVVTDWSRRHNCVGVDAPALPGNRAAKAFFETHGFVARLLIMHRPESDPA